MIKYITKSNEGRYYELISTHLYEPGEQIIHNGKSYTVINLDVDKSVSCAEIAESNYNYNYYGFY